MTGVIGQSNAALTSIAYRAGRGPRPNLAALELFGPVTIGTIGTPQGSCPGLDHKNHHPTLDIVPDGDLRAPDGIPDGS